MYKQFSRTTFARALLVLLLAGWLALASIASARYTGLSPQVFLPLVIRPYAFDRLLITEVMYDPDGTPDQGEVEWIEIYNPTAGTVDLSGYKIGDEETLGGPEAMLQFPAGASIAPGQVIVIAGDALAFQAAYGFAPDYEASDSGSPVPDMLKYAAWANGSLNLSNSADEVLLLDVRDELVDAVSWGSSIWAFDPAVPVAGKGNSLERFPAYVDTDSAGDWRALAVPQPGDVNLAPLTPTPTPTPPGPTPTPFGGGLLISEVLYDPVGSEPNAEWIEIYNATSATIDLSGFKIGDEETQGDSEGTYRFPDAATIAPGETILIANKAADFESAYGFQPDFELNESDPAVPDMLKYTPWSSGSMSLSNSGDEVLLLDYGDNVVDTVSWGTSNWAFDPPAASVAEGHSLERVPAYLDTDSAQDWRDQPNPTPGGVDISTPTPSPTPTLTPTPFGGVLLISEVLYDPAAPEPANEWIEIYNPTADTLDLSGFKIGDEELQGGSEGMLQFPPGASIGPGQVLVIARDAGTFLAAYGFDPDYEMQDSGSAVPDMLVYTLWGGSNVSLSNTGDEVLLLDYNDNVVDAVSWGSSNWAFDPPVAGVAEGSSIERSPAGQDTDSAADWVEQATPDPGNVN